MFTGIRPDHTGAGHTCLRAAVDIQEITSPGGIKAWLVEEHSIPFTALEIRFRGGTSLDLPGKRGAVNLMTALIEEGAGDLDVPSGFAAAAQDALAAELSTSTHYRRCLVTVSARFLSENRDEAIALLLQSALDRNRALTRIRGGPRARAGSVRSSGQTDEGDPERASPRATFNRHGLWQSSLCDLGPGRHRLKSVTALTRDDIVTALQPNTVARDRIYVGAAGDITAEDLGALA